MSDAIDGPHRLHPASLIIAAIKGMPSILYLLPLLGLVVKEQGVGVALLALGGGLVAFALYSVVVTWLRWRAFTYAIHDDALVIERGVIRRDRRAIPRQRIQDVSIEQRPLARILGIVTVRIEGGGGEADEGLLDGVGMAEARRLREALRGERPVAAQGKDTPVDAPAERLFAMGPERLILHGLFSFSLLWLAALAALFKLADRFLDIKAEQVMAWLGIIEHEAVAHASVATVSAAIIVVLLLGFASGIVRVFLGEYGFRLLLSEGRFRRVQGLLTRTEVVIARRRIQMTMVHRGWFAGLFGWQGLSVQSLGDGLGWQVLAPFARARELERIVDATGLARFERPGMTLVSPRHIVRVILTKVFPVAGAIGVAGFFYAPIWWALLIAPVMLGTALLRRHFHRYAVRDDSFQIMRGVRAQSDIVANFGAMQSVTISQSILQRMLGIATTLADTSGGGLEVEDMRTEDAIQLGRDLHARI